MSRAKRAHYLRRFGLVGSNSLVGVSLIGGVDVWSYQVDYRGKMVLSDVRLSTNEKTDLLVEVSPPPDEYRNWATCETWSYFKSVVRTQAEWACLPAQAQCRRCAHLAGLPVSIVTPDIEFAVAEGLCRVGEILGTATA